MEYLFQFINIWALHIPVHLALAVTATIGYLVGRRSWRMNSEFRDHSKRELRRAQLVAAELEKITLEVQKNLVKHHSNISRFKDNINKINDKKAESAWKDLCREAEEMLKPTLKLASQIANAYDEIRQQSANLMTFTEVQTDPLTGVKNRRAMNEAVIAQFALMSRYETPFSVIMFDIDYFKRINDEQGHLHGDSVLRELAQFLDEEVRETDVVTRYGGDEFIVIMPQTDLEGACMLGERLRTKIYAKLSVTVSGGVSSAIKDDDQESLLKRADAALYQAKTSGRNGVFRHNGTDIIQVSEEPAPSLV
jgi:diguanylate cyclase